MPSATSPRVQTAENPADPTQTSTLHTVAKLADRNEDPRVRGLAAEALTEAGERRAVPSLIAVLGDPSVEVRFWAAFALGQLGDPAALRALERLAETDDAELPGWRSVKDEAADAIERIRQHAANCPESRKRASPGGHCGTRRCGSHRTPDLAAPNPPRYEPVGQPVLVSADGRGDHHDRPAGVRARTPPGRPGG